MTELQATLSHTLVQPRDTAGRTVVVIDVLRASTTIITALAHGAKDIVPCLHVDEAVRQAADDRLEGLQPLLGGERGGLRIDGFDLGNSPSEYSREIVAGRRIYFTTTNGTQALLKCPDAARVLIGSFVNLSAVCRAIASDRFLHVLCAGTNGEISREDVLLAGAMIDRILQSRAEACELNDSARLAMEVWRYVSQPWAAAEPVIGLAEQLEHSIGGRNLVAIGHASDVRFAAEIDRFDVVPQVDPANWRIGLP